MLEYLLFMLEKKMQVPRNKQKKELIEDSRKSSQETKKPSQQDDLPNKRIKKEKEREKEKEKKDPNTLHGNLAILSNKTKLNILDFLSDSGRSMKYSEIMHEIDKWEKDSVNLNYHLKDLIEAGMVEGDRDVGYYLSPYGKKIVKVLVDFSEVVTTRGEPVYIRNSRYEKEEFKEEEIVEFLVKEGGFVEKDARLIAKEAKTRLFASKVKYITTPLIREFLNAILIEHGLEEKRHSLTRLGIPPYDFHQYLIGDKQFDIPDDLFFFSGSLVAEQYLLLNGLPRAISEMIIDGFIYLNNISTFFTKPLSIGLTSEALIRCLTNSMSSTDLSNIDDVSFYKQMDRSLQRLMDFFLGGITILDFENFILLWDLYVPKPISLFSSLITENKYMHKIILNILCENSENQLENLSQFFKLISEFAESELLHVPLINLFVSHTFIEKIQENVRNNDYKSFSFDFITHILSDLPGIITFQSKSVIGKSERLSAFSEFTISDLAQTKEHSNVIVLDKFAINLAMLWKKTQDKDEFFALLYRCLTKLIFLFDLKYTVMNRSRATYTEWDDLMKHCWVNMDPFSPNELFSERKGETTMFICSIGIIGVHEAVVLYSGYDQPTSVVYKNALHEIFGRIHEFINGVNKKNPFVKCVISESDLKFEFIKRAKKEFFINTLSDSDYSDINFNHPSIYSSHLTKEPSSVLDCYSPSVLGRTYFIPGLKLPKSRSQIELRKIIFERIVYAIEKGLVGLFFIPYEIKPLKSGDKNQSIVRNAWNYYYEKDINEFVFKILQ